jgi:hypothetical protein
LLVGRLVGVAPEVTLALDFTLAGSIGVALACFPAAVPGDALALLLLVLLLAHGAPFVEVRGRSVPRYGSEKRGPRGQFGSYARNLASE